MILLNHFRYIKLNKASRNCSSSGLCNGTCISEGHLAKALEGLRRHGGDLKIFDSRPLRRSGGQWDREAIQTGCLRIALRQALGQTGHKLGDRARM